MSVKYFMGGPLDGKTLTKQECIEQRDIVKQYRQLNVAYPFGYKTPHKRLFKKIKSFWIYKNVLDDMWKVLYGELD